MPYEPMNLGPVVFVLLMVVAGGVLSLVGIVRFWNWLQDDRRDDDGLPPERYR